MKKLLLFMCAMTGMFCYGAKNRYTNKTGANLQISASYSVPTSCSEDFSFIEDGGFAEFEVGACLLYTAKAEMIGQNSKRTGQWGRTDPRGSGTATTFTITLDKTGRPVIK